jgi:hypothetical protein
MSTNALVVNLDEPRPGTSPIGTTATPLVTSLSVASGNVGSVFTPLSVSQYGALPSGVTAVTGTSGNVANATAAANLPGVSAKTTYIMGFCITAGGATAAAIVNVSLLNVITGTMIFNFGVPTGATLMAQPLVVLFNTPIPANAVNTAIQLSMPALGAGNTNAAVNVWGFQI